MEGARQSQARGQGAPSSRPTSAGLSSRGGSKARLILLGETVGELLASFRELLPKVEECLEQVGPINDCIERRTLARRLGQPVGDTEDDGFHDQITRLYAPFRPALNEASTLFGQVRDLMSRVPRKPSELLVIRDEILQISWRRQPQWPVSMSGLFRDLRAVELRLAEMLEVASDSNLDEGPKAERRRSSREAQAPVGAAWDPAKLKRARKKRGHSQEEMAAILRVTPSTASRWERGEISRPHPDHQQAIEDYIREAGEDVGD